MAELPEPEPEPEPKPKPEQKPETSLPPTPNVSVFNKLDAEDSGRTPLIHAEDENVERGNWSGRFDFILSLLGYAVGLGNIWRFPYLCYRNGGGAFLLPFVLMIVIIGLPMFVLEAALGQFCSAGPTACWEFAPLFKGLGIAMIVVSGLTTIYYNMILAWAFYYLYASLSEDLPWITCDAEWNSNDCSLKLPKVKCNANTEVKNMLDGTCTDGSSGDFLGLWNISLFQKTTGRIRVSPSEEYWHNKALAISSGIDELGQPKWDLTICLLLAWITCFFCLLKGIKTTGKVVYFTAIFPYVVLIILLIRGATLDNAGEGVYYFIVPDFERLLDARVWNDAANQIFFSLSVACGGLTTLSSYNRFHNNIMRDSLIVTIGDTLTCLFGGVVIFCYLGYMAGNLGVEVDDVVKDGAGLAFIVYPEAVSNLAPPTLWSILFFIMLLTLGLDSQFAMLETVFTGIMDQYPNLRPQKILVVFGCCFIFFLLGLPLTCPGGMYLLQLMDNYVGGLTLTLIGFFEIVAVIYVYGCDRFCLDIRVMTGITLAKYWKVAWYALTPFTIVFLFIFNLVDYVPTSYGDYSFPLWADLMGWLMAIFTIIFIPVYMIFRVSIEKGDGDWIQKFRSLNKPSYHWGPALLKHRKLVDYVNYFEFDPYTRKAQEDALALHDEGFKGGNRSNSNVYTNLTSLRATLYALISRHSSVSPSEPTTQP